MSEITPPVEPVAEDTKAPNGVSQATWDEHVQRNGKDAPLTVSDALILKEIDKNTGRVPGHVGNPYGLTYRAPR